VAPVMSCCDVGADSSPRQLGLTNARKPHSFFDTIDEATEQEERTSGSQEEQAGGDGSGGGGSAGARAAGRDEELSADDQQREAAARAAMADVSVSQGTAEKPSEMKEVLRAGLSLLRRKDLGEGQAQRVPRPVTDHLDPVSRAGYDLTTGKELDPGDHTGGCPVDATQAAAADASEDLGRLVRAAGPTLRAGMDLFHRRKFEDEGGKSKPDWAGADTASLDGEPAGQAAADGEGDEPRGGVADTPGDSVEAGTPVGDGEADAVALEGTEPAQAADAADDTSSEPSEPGATERGVNAALAEVVAEAAAAPDASPDAASPHGSAAAAGGSADGAVGGGLDLPDGPALEPVASAEGDFLGGATLHLEGSPTVGSPVGTGGIELDDDSGGLKVAGMGSLQPGALDNDKAAGVAVPAVAADHGAGSAPDPRAGDEAELGLATRGAASASADERARNDASKGAVVSAVGLSAEAGKEVAADGASGAAPQSAGNATVGSAAAAREDALADEPATAAAASKGEAAAESADEFEDASEGRDQSGELSVG
jgi:hypothetical protein